MLQLAAEETGSLIWRPALRRNLMTGKAHKPTVRCQHTSVRLRPAKTGQWITRNHRLEPAIRGMR
jgi:hypothetical protein